MERSDVGHRAGPSNLVLVILTVNREIEMRTFSAILSENVNAVLYERELDIVGCRAVTMQRPRGKQIYHRQRLGKHIPVTTMIHQERNSVFCVVRAEILQPGQFGASS
jgi:hypothetical protein